MRRGTTPVHKFTVPEEVPLGQFSAIWLSYAQFSRVILDKTIDDMTVDLENNQLIISLTQAETLKFQAGKEKVEVQMRAKTADDKAVASDILEIDVKRILKGGVI